MKKELIFSLIFLIHLTLNAQLNPTIYAETIESEDLKGLLYTYASDYFAGRDTGKKGQKIAVDFLRDYYLNKGITSAQNSENFFQKMN